LTSARYLDASSADETPGVRPSQHGRRQSGVSARKSNRCCSWASVRSAVGYGVKITGVCVLVGMGMGVGVCVAVTVHVEVGVLVATVVAVSVTGGEIGASNV